MELVLKTISPKPYWGWYCALGRRVWPWLKNVVGKFTKSVDVVLDSFAEMFSNANACLLLAKCARIVGWGSCSVFVEASRAVVAEVYFCQTNLVWLEARNKWKLHQSIRAVWKESLSSHFPAGEPQVSWIMYSSFWNMWCLHYGRSILDYSMAGRCCPSHTLGSRRCGKW